MSGRFTFAKEVAREKNDWGNLVWLSSPRVCGARDLVVIEVTLLPGGGHGFHRHPRQEEVIYVIRGRPEQWVDQERHRLEPGDSAFIPDGVVHATFNPGEESVGLLAILGPCIGEEGYELEDMAEREPWRSLRASRG